MPLETLTETQAADYVASLDLAEGSEAQRTIGAMMLLPPAAFVRGISALAQGLITFSAVRALSAMNERLLDALIAARLGDDDQTTLAWRYREEWLPASISVSDLRRSAIGSPKDAVAARFIDKWGGVIRPAYDFLKTDETKFHSYNEAYITYMLIAGGSDVAEAIQYFRDAHARLRAASPDLLQASDTDCPLLALVESIATQPVFLERANGSRAANQLLDWLMSGSWRGVEPGNYARFMQEVACPAMAASDDPGRTGLPGASQVYAAHQWSPIGTDNPGWSLDLPRMARIHLPEVFGIMPAHQLDAEKAANSLLLSYLDAAYTAVSKAHEILSHRMAADASLHRARIGSPIGLTLCFTLSN
jgi:hypothetical protein